MDVRCSRCGTEYEFDDALISERGTTVKCTNCGFQFKIFPGEGKGGAPERWVVRTTAGRELVYTSLRELQRGIADKKVGPNDLLSRGKQPARPLGSIAELEPFFQVTVAHSPADSDRMQRTLHGVAPPANSIGGSVVKANPVAPAPRPAPAPAAPLSSTLALPQRPPRAPAARASERSPPPPSSESDWEVQTKRITQPRGTPATLDAAAARQEAGSFSATLPVDFAPRPHATWPNGSPGASGTPSPTAPPTLQVPEHLAEIPPDEVSRPSAPIPLQSTRASTFDSTLEAAVSPRALVSSPRNLPPFSVANMRDSFASYDELQLDMLPDDSVARRARSRWIAGVVIIGVVGLLGATVGRRYIAKLGSGSEVKTSSDARVAKFLSDGEKLLDEGDFEGAKEEFDKATALAEKDPAVLTALARLETLRADVSWLKLRLLDPNSTDLVQATYRELGRRVGKARTAVDRAFAISPEDPAVLRARIDALRLSGDGDKAREWIAPLSANASVPENAYVLAALDLAEPSPVWPSVIDRLRSAASAERDPGRGRAALIYALARANRLSEAEAEFAKIDGRAKPHPLLEELRAFLLRAKTTADAGVDAGPKLAAVDPAKLPKLDTSPGPPGEEAAPRAAAPVAGDFRARLTQAAEALKQGDLARADQLYNSVLSEQPGNTEAMSGLGDVAKQRHNPAAAAKMYDRVLAQNPSYLPAILASADQKWEAGDKKGALVLYRRLVEQAGSSSEYGARAAARIAQGEGSPGGSTAPTTAPVDTPPAAPKPAAPSPEPPATPPAGIDTTDLPGVK